MFSLLVAKIKLTDFVFYAARTVEMYKTLFMNAQSCSTSFLIERRELPPLDTRREVAFKILITFKTSLTTK